jgi:hypothetical protein
MAGAGAEEDRNLRNDQLINNYMKKTLKTFAMTMLLTGATVTAARAAATTTTNTQVLHNISIQLKVYSQGALNATTDKSLAANVTTFTTSDLIQNLAVITSNAFSPGKSDKLVLATTYSNFLVGTPNTSIIDSSVAINTNVALANVALVLITNLPPGIANVPGFTNGTNVLPLIGTTNVYAYGISNGFVVQVTVVSNTPTATNFVGTITTNVILTNGTVAAIINTNSILDLNLSNSLGYWTEIFPLTSTNIVIEQLSPQTNMLFTNASSSICVMTPTSATATAALIPVDHWIKLSTEANLNGQSIDVYAENGNNLSGSDFSGTNITSQTVYSIQHLNINTVYPTNTPAGYTNLYLTNSAGFSKEVTQLINLTVKGNAKEKAVFQTIGSDSIAIAGTGYIQGSWTNSQTSTNTSSGVITTNYQVPLTHLGDPMNTNSVKLDFGWIADPIDVIYEGTVTITYLGADLVPLTEE